METRHYQVETYLAEHEAFHFARRVLSIDPVSAAHTHDYHELFLVEYGAANHWINGQLQTLNPGHVLFIRPHDTHALWAAGGRSCRILNVLFRSETADHLFERYGTEFGQRFFWSKAQMPAAYLLTGPRLKQAVAGALDLQTAQRSLSRIEDFLLTMMTRIIESPETASACLPTWLVSACEQAREPEVFREGAAGFVRVAGRGHEHVCRKTKEHLGVTPSAFINRIRMEHAASLLAGEEMSVSDVADNCGIENMSHFYRVFRQHYGVTPKAYRKQHQRSPF